jgi:VWFA-related protein
LAHARNAADHFLSSSVQVGDRVALYTSSGQKQVDFTSDLARVRQALLDLRPRPLVGSDTTCDAVPPYEAFLIIERNDPTALSVAADQVTNCSQGQITGLSAQIQAQAGARRALMLSETESTAVLRGIENIVRRMSSLPGQRSIIIVSVGFLTETLRFNLSTLTDRALRSNVILNALDARGLYTDSEILDASENPFAHTSAPYTGSKTSILMEGARRQTDGMQTLAVDTGGAFFNTSNDLEAGFRKFAGLREAYYVLAFSPQNLKFDGTFHPLQVKLVAPKGLSVQARHGYFAPKKPNDPAEQEKEEIQEAVFSQDEMHELPIDVHTQFFMKSESDARITVLTRIDLHDLPFRKEENRNLENLIFATAVFDRDGHLITGEQKTLQLRMLDATLEKYRQTGITMRSSFDVKPGTYLVRSVVRDSEGGEISSLNRTVEIPY